MAICQWPKHLQEGFQYNTMKLFATKLSQQPRATTRNQLGNAHKEMACGCWGWGGGCVTRAKLQRPNKMFLLIFNQVLKVFHCNEHLHPIIRKINANGSELAHNLPVAPKSIASVNTLWVPQSNFQFFVIAKNLNTFFLFF